MRRFLVLCLLFLFISCSEKDKFRNEIPYIDFSGISATSSRKSTVKDNPNCLFRTYILPIKLPSNCLLLKMLDNVPTFEIMGEKFIKYEDSQSIPEKKNESSGTVTGAMKISGLYRSEDKLMYLKVTELINHSHVFSVKIYNNNINQTGFSF